MSVPFEELSSPARIVFIVSIGAFSAGELVQAFRLRRGATRGEGSGLGLTVVRALAQAHGGTASLRTSAAGGVSAIVSLPRGPITAMKAVA